jgi:muramoyltetrapeptide carboxypeptidase
MDIRDTGAKWFFLEKGDPIHIVAPAYGISTNYMEKVRQNILKYGFKPEMPVDINAPQGLGYSNTDSYRAHHLKSVLTDDRVKVIWALQGGRGSSLLLSFLKDLPRLISPKLIVGFSDITALYLWAATRNWPSLHGIVLAYNKEMGLEANKESSMDALIPVLKGDIQELEYKLEPLNNTSKQDLVINGSIVGGNLSLIQRSIGTETNLQTAGKIIFLEDKDDTPTRLYESLNHLERAGLFQSPKAIIWGNFTLVDQNIEKFKIVQHIFADKMDRLNIPVVHSLNFGHGPKNYPLPFNTAATLRLGNSHAILTVKTNN